MSAAFLHKAIYENKIISDLGNFAVLNHHHHDDNVAVNYYCILRVFVFISRRYEMVMFM